MITIEETRDVKWMDSVLRTPEVFNSQYCDGSPDIRNISVGWAVGGKNKFLKVLVNGKSEGFLIARWMGHGTYEIHAVLDKGCRGVKAYTAGRMIRDYLFAVCGASRLVGKCPGYAPNSVVFARKVGLKIDREAMDACSKFGKKYKVTHVSMDRDSWQQIKKG